MRSLHSFPRPLKGILGTEKRELTQTAGIKLYFLKKSTKENTPIFLSPKKNPRSKYFQSETQQSIPKKFPYPNPSPTSFLNIKSEENGKKT